MLRYPDSIHNNEAVRRGPADRGPEARRMDRRFRRNAPAWPLRAAVLACATLAAGTARGQTGAPAGAAGEPAKKGEAAGAAAKAKAKAKAQAPRREPSKEYQESIRKTVEQRRRRRARRGQGPDDLRPVGAIVPWPMPPALIIRQTPQVHDEVGSLLDQLRRGK
jgi:hypothetical protein